MQKEYRLDYDVIIKSVESILKILSDNKTGFPNSKAKKDTVALAKKMREATTDVYIGEKTVGINIWAEVLYGDRKYQENDDSRENIDCAVSFLRRDCEEAQGHAEHVKNTGNATSKLTFLVRWLIC